MSENTNTTESLKTNWIKRNKRVILTVGVSVAVTAVVTAIIVKVNTAPVIDAASNAVQAASEAIDAVIDTAV
jgi:hypothetical protein